MIKKLNIVKDRSETQRGVQLSDGTIISLYDENGNFYLRFDNVIDLEKGIFYDDKCCRFDDPDYDKTLNGIIEKGGCKEVQCYDICEYNEDVYPDKFAYTYDKISKIVKYFKERGYNVTPKAVDHNIHAWFNDYKSGYRDEENGYHLFTPCGCNPLSLRLSTLHEKCDDWQITYEC